MGYMKKFGVNDFTSEKLLHVLKFVLTLSPKITEGVAGLCNSAFAITYYNNNSN